MFRLFLRSLPVILLIYLVFFIHLPLNRLPLGLFKVQERGLNAQEQKYILYGGSHGNGLFEEKSQKMLQEIEAILLKNRGGGFSLQAYGEFLKHVGEERQNLAKETQSNAWKNFGLLRSTLPLKKCNSIRTFIRGHNYKNWFEEMRSFVKKFITHIHLDKEKVEELRTAQQGEGVEIIKEEGESRYRFVLARKKTYAKRTTAHYYARLSFDYKVKGRWYQVTHYDINFYYPKAEGRPESLDPELFFRRVPDFKWTVRCGHKSCEHFEIFKKATYGLLKEIMRWDSGKHSPAQLKASLAKYHWLMAHWMPFYRGSASITEWITQGVSRLHGFNLTFKDAWRSQDQKALSRLQQEFMDGYEKNSILTPRS